MYILQVNKHPSGGAFDLQEALGNLIKIRIPYIQDGIPDTAYLKNSQIVPRQMTQELHFKWQDWTNRLHRVISDQQLEHLLGT